MPNRETSCGTRARCFPPALLLGLRRYVRGACRRLTGEDELALASLVQRLEDRERCRRQRDTVRPAALHAVAWKIQVLSAKSISSRRAPSTSPFRAAVRMANASACGTMPSLERSSVRPALPVLAPPGAERRRLRALHYSEKMSVPRRTARYLWACYDGTLLLTRGTSNEHATDRTVKVQRRNRRGWL